MSFIEYLKNNPLVCIHELQELKQRLKTISENSSFDSNDLRRSVFGQIYQILNTFLGGICFIISDHASEGFEVRTFGKTVCKSEPFDDQDLKSMFVFHFTNMCSNLIECVENFLKMIFREVFSSKAKSYGNGFITFPNLLEDFLRLGVINAQQKSILLDWMQLLRNPRHSNYVDKSGASLYLAMESYDQPFSVREQITGLIEVVIGIVSHSDVQQHDHLADLVRENDKVKHIKWYNFVTLAGKN